MRAEDLRVIELSGTPRECGRVHGETLRAVIREAIELREDAMAEATGVPPRDYLRDFLGDTDFVTAIEEWTPGLLDEVRGIAEGAALDADRVLAYQLIDEEWLYRKDRSKGGPEGAGDRCSTIGVFGQSGTPTLVAQNLDIEQWREGHQVVLRIRDPESPVESLLFSFAGLVALAGLNSAGVGVCVNALMDLDHRRQGLPVAFALRGLLQRDTLEDAVRFLLGVPHASGQNYMLGGPERARSLECSSEAVVEYVWQRNASRLCHTNHALTDIEGERPQGVSPERTADEIRARHNTEARLKGVENRLADAALPVGVKEIQATLGGHDDPENPVCRHGAVQGVSSIIGTTVGSMIYELSDDPVLHLAPGPPCETEYRKIGF